MRVCTIPENRKSLAVFVAYLVAYPCGEGRGGVCYVHAQHRRAFVRVKARNLCHGMRRGRGRCFAQQDDFFRSGQHALPDVMRFSAGQECATGSEPRLDKRLRRLLRLFTRRVGGVEHAQRCGHVRTRYVHLCYKQSFAHLNHRHCMRKMQ